jgi:hypothetical protein
MAISKSGRKQQGLTAGAFLYSGRPDPVWKVSNSVVKKLLELWNSLPITHAKAEAHPGMLGYRGCFLRGPGNREWVAFNGLVSLRTPKGVETRKDVARELEKQLFSSAPPGLLPDDLLRGKWS